MKAVIQRVSEGSVEVEGKIVGAIQKGLLIYLGVGKEDTIKDLEWLANKVLGLRIFADEEDKMNFSIEEIAGQILVISQFTLYGDLKKGNRPSFNGAADPEKANDFYKQFIQKLSERLPDKIEQGVFQAMMKVRSLNDGPVTILLDSQNKNF